MKNIISDIQSNRFTPILSGGHHDWRISHVSSFFKTGIVNFGFKPKQRHFKLCLISLKPAFRISLLNLKSDIQYLGFKQKGALPNASF